MAATILSLFSGYGGLDLACDAAWLGGAHAVAYCERDAYAQAVLLARMEEEALVPAPIWSDVTTFDGTPWRGVVDIVTAGFPCQPFSTAGKREGQDDERWLWGDIERVLREVQPRWIVLENVPGLVRHGLGPVLRTLAVLGYDAEWGLLRASDVGASHKRERIFILAKRRAKNAAVDAGGDLDDADSVQWRPARGRSDTKTDGRDHDRWRGPPLADATRHHRRCRERGEKAGVGPEAQRRGRPPSGESELVDAQRRGRRGGAVKRHEPATEQPTAIRRPLFAPGPADLDVWARVLTETPSLEPSVCRVADGTAEWLVYRNERLRALGNGVVPLQGAVAIRSLAARAGWELE